MGKENEQDEGEKDAGDALEAFFSQFGEMDGHAVVVLEEFFRELMDGQ